MNCYIHVHLNKTGDSKGELQALKNELLAIEDELAVEQIIIYRSLARAVFVRGGNQMPKSILELHDESRDLAKKVSSPSGSKGKTGFRSVKKSSNEFPSVLLLMEKQGEIARNRSKAGSEDPLPQYLAQLSSGQVGIGLNRLSSLHDETTIAHTIDTGAVRIARKKAFQLSDMSVTGKNGMLISFSMSMEKLEIVVVEEVDSFRGYAGPPSLTPASESSESGSKLALSDVSVLTDDKRFFQDGEDQEVVEEEGTDEPPVMSSTDFLIFQVPENVLVRIAVSPVEFSILARSGGSQNINVKVGEVFVLDGDDKHLFSIGVTSKKDAPVPEIEVGRKSQRDDLKTLDAADAVSLSLVMNKSGNILQCDTSPVRVQLEIEVLKKLQDFYNQPSAIFPGQVISPSPQEQVRLYILRQSTGPMSNLNCS